MAAFNPFKKTIIEQPNLEESAQYHLVNNMVENLDAVNQLLNNRDDDDLVNYSTLPISEIIDQKPLTYEGAKIADLQQTGLKTTNLLKFASNNIEKNKKYNLNYLKTIPLKSILKEFGAIEKSPYLYILQDYEIAIQENNPLNWFNKTKKTGAIGAINLAKHLIAQKENISEIEESKSLFKAACLLLDNLSNNKNTLMQDIVIQKNVQNNPKPEIIDSEVQTSVENKNPVENVVKNWKSLTTQQQQEKKELNKQITKELNEIPLTVILEFIGSNGNEDEQSGKWKIHDTGHNVGLYGVQQWKNWNTGTSGKGGISLYADMLINRDNIFDEKQAFWQARSIVLEEFRSDISEETYKRQLGEAKAGETFYMPHVIDFKINEVKTYLHEKRGIPNWILNKQIKEGLLFAGAPSWWKNDVPFLHNPQKLANENVWAIFLGTSGEAAEMRAIDRYDFSAKILAKGSVKNSGGFMLKPEKDCNEKTLVACEGAIDACSYHSIYPGRAATSCMGVNFNLAVELAFEILESPSWKFELAYDNDRAGHEATLLFQKSMIEELGEEQYQQLLDSGKIKYFDLSIRCLQKCMELNQTFYFDISNTLDGREVATLFQKQASKVIPIEDIRQFMKAGKLKYANVCPMWEMMKDSEAEAKKVFDLLNSDTPYYYRAKTIELDKEDSHRLTLKYKAFEKSFDELAKEKKEQWIKEGKIIFEKIAIAKDWNEYAIYLQKKPEIKDLFEQRESHYSTIHTNPRTLKFKI